VAADKPGHEAAIELRSGPVLETIYEEFVGGNVC